MSTNEDNRIRAGKGSVRAEHAGTNGPYDHTFPSDSMLVAVMNPCPIPLPTVDDRTLIS
jgi:hypothetical protein